MGGFGWKIPCFDQWTAVQQNHFCSCISGEDFRTFFRELRLKCREWKSHVGTSQHLFIFFEGVFLQGNPWFLSLVEILLYRFFRLRVFWVDKIKCRYAAKIICPTFQSSMWSDFATKRGSENGFTRTFMEEYGTDTCDSIYSQENVSICGNRRCPKGPSPAWNPRISRAFVHGTSKIRFGKNAFCQHLCSKHSFLKV